MKKFKIIYSFIGGVLVSLLIFTGSRGLSNKNSQIYEKACNMQDVMDKKVWEGIGIKNYPIAIRKGAAEYVFYENEVKKRKPVIPVYACSVYPVNNDINILMPSFEEMNVIGDIVEGISDGTNLFKSQFGLSKSSISENQYISIIYHEALHAYQFSNFEDMLNKIGKFDSKDGDKVIEKIDNNDSLKNLYKREGNLLYEAIIETDNSKVKGYVKEYINTRSKRIEAIKNVLNKKEFETLIAVEEYYELIEGTARYIEIKTVEILKDKELYEKYMDGLKDFNGKREKYYKSGMAMCIILERFNSEWKDNIFSEEKPLYEKLCEDIKLNK